MGEHDVAVDVDDSNRDGHVLFERLGLDAVCDFLDSAELGISRWRYEPGKKTRGHRHEVQEEVYAVISGSGRVKLDDEIIEIKQWDVIRVAPQVARGFEAGPEGLEIIAAGGSKPEGGDGELVEDHWPDE